MRSTREPFCAMATARLVEVVVFPSAGTELVLVIGYSDRAQLKAVWYRVAADPDT